MTDWKLADAKNRLSELVNLALTKGPQHIRRRADEVVVISAREYERLLGTRQSFKSYLFEGESLQGLDLKRDRSPIRDIHL